MEPALSLPNFSDQAKSQPKRQRTRALLLDAASEVLAERGPLASVSEIAERAGVAIGTFYNHFGNREELLQQLSQAIADAVTREMEAWLPVGGDAAHSLARGLVALITILGREPEWGWAFVKVDNPFTPPFTDRMTYGLIRRRIEEGVRAGRFTAEVDDFLVYFIDNGVRTALRAQLEAKEPGAAPRKGASLILRALGVPPGEAELLCAKAHEEVIEILQRRS